MTDRTSAGSASFSGHDWRRLTLRLKRTSDGRLFRRVQAVLRIVEGDSIRSVASSLHVSERSIQRWVEIYQQRRHPEDLVGALRPGRPREADDLDAERLAELLAQDPRVLGYRATTWTTPLLAPPLKQECGCPISERTLRRRLHTGGRRWKRLRYVFCEREAAVGPKKGRAAA